MRQKGIVKGLSTQGEVVQAHLASSSQGSQVQRSTRQRHRAARAFAVTKLRDTRAVQDISERECARQLDVAPSTLRGWEQRAVNDAGRLESFLESPEGVYLLHRVLVAALFVFVIRGGMGVSLVRMFLELCGLAPYLACSDSHLRQLVENKSDKRDAQTWDDVLTKATEGMNVVIHLVTSDEARGLVSVANNFLGVVHSSDVFHGQHELYKGLLPAMRVKLTCAEAKLEQSKEQVKKLVEQRDSYQQCPHGIGRPPNWEAKVEKATAQVDNDALVLETLVEQQTGLKDCVKDIGKELHPIDRETGQWTTAESEREKLTGIFEEIWQRVTEMSLSERVGDHITKAQKLVGSWAGSIAWFHKEVARRLDEAKLCVEKRALMMTVLIPVAYLQMAIAKADSKTLRESIRKVMEKVSMPLEDPVGLWQGMSEVSRRELEEIARECAGYFQRANSCVEGRNGYLSLRYHHMRSMPEAWLKALTVIHNYVIKRADGTTAAERYFGKAPGDLFQ